MQRQVPRARYDDGVKRRSRRSKRGGGGRPRTWWRRLAAGWRALRPRWARVLVGLTVLAVLALFYQVLKKPTELLGVVPTAAKGPSSTWSAYGALFRENATDVVTPELLAALVQVESAGDPLARTYWRWRFSWNPLDLYGPASSAVGLLQLTDGAFAEARQLCIHDHRVVQRGPWRDPRACWFNDLYVRWLPSNAIEMTAAWLDQAVRETLGDRLLRSTPEQQLRLAGRHPPLRSPARRHLRPARLQGAPRGALRRSRARPATSRASVTSSASSLGSARRARDPRRRLRGSLITAARAVGPQRAACSRARSNSSPGAQRGSSFASASRSPTSSWSCASCTVPERSQRPGAAGYSSDG